jgi:DNA polymerase I-like protein with 3'-5' exonuclease and polymerase domains
MIAEKPLDLHSLMSVKLGISRSDAKSFNYGIIYGAGPPKLAKMLGVSLERGKQLYDEFWETVPALKELKVEKETEWENSGKVYITSLDDRQIRIRSKHSILNALFQSSAIAFAKYVTVLVDEKLNSLGYVTSPFASDPDVCSMIENHD